MLNLYTPGILNLECVNVYNARSDHNNIKILLRKSFNMQTFPKHQKNHLLMQYTLDISKSNGHLNKIGIANSEITRSQPKYKNSCKNTRYRIYLYI